MSERADIIKEINIAKKQVERILAKDERCRNNDLWLCIEYWRQSGIRFYVDYKDLKEMATPETITRARRIVQNTDGKYLPTDPQILIRRQVKEGILRQYFADNQNIIAEWQRLKGLK